jgi:hypothetical protein
MREQRTRAPAQVRRETQQQGARGGRPEEQRHAPAARREERAVIAPLPLARRLDQPPRRELKNSHATRHPACQNSIGCRVSL